MFPPHAELPAAQRNAEPGTDRRRPDLRAPHAGHRRPWTSRSIQPLARRRARISVITRTGLRRERARVTRQTGCAACRGFLPLPATRLADTQPATDPALALVHVALPS